VRHVAERTFKFVKVLELNSSAKSVEAESSSLAFEPIKAPWQTDLERWQAYTREYTAVKKRKPPGPFAEISLRQK